MQSELAGDQLSSSIGVCGGARAATHDIVGDVVDLLTVLLEDGSTRCGACIRAKNDAVFEDDTGNGGARLTGFRRGIAFLEEKVVPQNIIEREPRSGRGGRHFLVSQKFERQRKS